MPITTVKELMEKSLLSVSPDTPAAEAAALLQRHGLGSLPVVEDGKLVGIITEADLVRFARRYFEWEMLGEGDRPGALPG